MLNAQLIAKLGQQITSLMPAQASATQKEIEKNIHLLLQSAFAKLDLVTREEFDAQTAVLQRTREKVDQLEALVSQLENELRPPAP